LDVGLGLGLGLRNIYYLKNERNIHDFSSLISFFISKRVEDLLQTYLLCLRVSLLLNRIDINIFCQLISYLINARNFLSRLLTKFQNNFFNDLVPYCFENFFIVLFVHDLDFLQFLLLILDFINSRLNFHLLLIWFDNYFIYNLIDYINSYKDWLGIHLSDQGFQLSVIIINITYIFRLGMLFLLL